MGALNLGRKFSPKDEELPINVDITDVGVRRGYKGPIDWKDCEADIIMDYKGSKMILSSLSII